METRLKINEIEELLRNITPGKWVAFEDTICANLNRRKRPAQADWIVQTVDPEGFGDMVDDGTRIYSPMCEANEALILAAPDTARKYAEALAELERVREALEAVGQAHQAGSILATGAPGFRVLMQARSALAPAPEERP